MSSKVKSVEQVVLTLPIPLSRGLRVRGQEAGGTAASHTAPLEGKLETGPLPGRHVLPYQLLPAYLVLTTRKDQITVATRSGKSPFKRLHLSKTDNRKPPTFC